MEQKEDKDARETTNGDRDHKRRHERDRQRNDDRKLAPSGEAFRGRHKDLMGSVYTYEAAAQAYQYNKTTDAIAAWVKLNLKFPMDVWQVLTTLKEPNKKEWVPKPPDLDMDPEIKQMIMSESVKRYTKRLAEYEENCCTVFTIVFEQCSDTLQAKLRGQEGWESTFEKNDLLKLIKSIPHMDAESGGIEMPISSGGRSNSNTIPYQAEQVRDADRVSQTLQCRNRSTRAHGGEPGKIVDRSHQLFNVDSRKSRQIQR